MVTRRPAHVPAERPRPIPGSAQSGSAVVIALAVAMVLTVVAGTVTARSVGALTGAAAAHDRLLARTVAEDSLHTTIRLLDDVASRTGDVAAFAASGIEPVRAPWSSEEAEVTVAVDEDGEDVTVRVDVVVGVSTHTATARLRPRSSADLAWLVETSVRDPLLQGLPRASCARSREDAGLDPACTEIHQPWDTITGPIHTNDVIGERDPMSTSALATSSVLDGTSAGGHRSEVALPRDVVTVLGGRVPTCRFRGPTLIRFDGPRIRVISPRSVPRPDEPDVAQEEIGCLGVDRGSLASVQVLDLPPSAVIEVIEDRSDDCVLHPLGIDPTEDLERDWRCDAGDAFVWGRYEGARTVLANDSVQVVWDLEPGDASGARSLAHGDVLGLVAGDSVILRRPIGEDPITTFEDVVPFAGPDIPPFGGHPLDAPVPTPATWESPRIVASVAALRGSFSPQNSGYGRAPSGDTTVVGSVASRFAPSTRMPIVFFGWVLGWRDFPLTIEYDVRLEGTPPPALPHLDAGRLRIVEMDVG